MRLAVSIFIRSCLGVLIFRKSEGLEVSVDSFVYLIIDVFSSLDIEFQWSNLQISEKKLILTSPELSEFHEKLQNLATATSVLALEKQLCFF